MWGAFMKNRFFDYEKKWLWKPETWNKVFSPLIPLVHRLEELNHERWRIKPGILREGDYDAKTNSVMYPEVLARWEERGITLNRFGMGGTRWLAAIPRKHFGTRGYDADLLTLVVFCDVDYNDKTWLMESVAAYQDLLEYASSTGSAVVFVFTDGVSQEDLYISILQEAVVLFHLNYNKMVADVTPAILAGQKLSEIPGFRYLARQGRSLNPDSEKKN